MYFVEFQSFPANKLQERGIFYPFFSDVAYSSMVFNIMQIAIRIFELSFNLWKWDNMKTDVNLYRFFILMDGLMFWFNDYIDYGYNKFDKRISVFDFCINDVNIEI